MVEGPPDDLDEQGPEEGRILSPEELDISESENVEQLDEGRFVVSPDGPPNVGAKRGAEPQQEPESGSAQRDAPREDEAGNATQQSGPRQPGKAGRQGGDGQSERRGSGGQPRAQTGRQGRGGRRGEAGQGELTEEVVHRWLRRSFEQQSSTYAFDVTATFEGQVSQRRMASNDVVTIFESLMLWYAQQVDSDTPVEEILGILLMESNVPIKYPPESIHSLVKSSGLTPEDDIADLLAEIDDGVKF